MKKKCQIQRGVSSSKKIIFHFSLFILFSICVHPKVLAQASFDVQRWTGAWGSDGHISTGDLNGDGKTDIFMWKDAIKSWMVNISTGNGFTIQNWVHSYGTTAPVYTGDLNHDGKTDVFFWDESEKVWRVNLSTGNSFLAKPWSGAWGTDGPINVGDLNGDGKDDVFMWRDGSKDWTVNISTGTGFIQQIWHGAWGSDGQIHVGDLNGDGKADVFMWNNSMRNWSINLSTGESFNAQAWSGASGSSGKIHVGDLNGDGKTDVFTWNVVDGWQINLSKGNGFENQQWNGFDEQGYNSTIGDFNGDGKSDIAICDVKAKEWLVNISVGNGFKPVLSSGAMDSESLTYVGDLNGDHFSDIFMWKGGDKTWIVNLGESLIPQIAKEEENSNSNGANGIEKYSLQWPIEADKDRKGGGRAVAISLNPVNNNSIWVATPTGGLFHSTTAGNTWSHIDQFPEWGCFCVKICPTDTNTIVVTCIEDTKVNNGGGVWVSKDGGNNWIHPSSSIARLSDGTNARFNAYGISYQPGTQNIYVGTDSGFIKSSDLGLTWRYIYPSLPPTERMLSGRTGSPDLSIVDMVDHSKIGVFSILALANGNVITFGTRGVLISDQSFSNWRIPNNLLGEELEGWRIHNAIAVSPYYDNHLFFTNKYDNLFYSIDGGENWEKIETPYIDQYTKDHDGSRQVFVKISASPIQMIGSIGTSINLYYSEYAALYKKLLFWNGSDYSFTASWELVNLNGADNSDLDFSKTNMHIMYATNDQGIEKYDVISGWSQLGKLINNYDALQVNDVKSILFIGNQSKNHIYFGTQDNGLFGSDNNGLNWAYNAPEGGCFEGPSILSNNGKYAYHYNFYYPPWHVYSEPLFTNTKRNEEINMRFLQTEKDKLSLPIYHAVDNTFFTFFGVKNDQTGKEETGLFISTDGGQSWPYTPAFKFGFTSILKNPHITGPSSNPSIIMAYSAWFYIGLFRIDNAFNQIPSDEVISIIHTPDFSSIGTYAFNIASFGVDPKNPNFIILPDIVNGKIWITSNGGISWDPRPLLFQLVTDNSQLLFTIPKQNELNRPSFELSNIQVTCISFDPLNSNNILIGTTEAGVLFSNDHGTNWSRIPGSFAIPNITSIAFIQNDQAVASTWGRGMWKIFYSGSKTSPNITDDVIFKKTKSDQIKEHKIIDEVLNEQKNQPSIQVIYDTYNDNSKKRPLTKLIGKNWSTDSNNYLQLYIDDRQVQFNDIIYPSDGMFTATLPKLAEPRLYKIKVIQYFGKEVKKEAVTTFKLATIDKESGFIRSDKLSKDYPETKKSRQLNELVECSRTVDFWFGKINNTWPDINGSNPGNITIGGIDYDEKTGRAIANASTPNIEFDVKHVFMLLVTLKLSNVPTDNPVWKYATECENWLTSLGRIHEDNIQNNNKKLIAFVREINNWINSHLCK